MAESEILTEDADGGVIKGCSIENFEALSKSKENPNGILVIIEQQGCGSCLPFAEAAKQAVADKVKILERGVEDESCLAMAIDMKVTHTPTAIFYRQSQEAGRVNPSGKTIEVVKEELAALVSRKGPEVVGEQVNSVPISPKPLITSDASMIKDRMTGEKERPAGAGGCKVDLDVEDNNWMMELMPGPKCENVIAELKKLGPASRSLLARHLASDDPELGRLIRDLKRK